MTNHTKWTYKKSESNSIGINIFQEGYSHPIFFTTDISDSSESRAKLVASAPAILEALIELSEKVQLHDSTGIMYSSYTKALNAIKKATI